MTRKPVTFLSLTLHSATLRKDQVVARLAVACRDAGSQKAFAAKAGVSEAYVSDVVNGRREPGDGILLALGLRKKVGYVETEARS